MVRPQPDPPCPLSSAVEHLVYTEAVGGSIPSAGISITILMEEFNKKLKEIESKLDDVNRMMQELKEAYTPYEHPWYRVKRNELIASGNYEE